ncbi:MAG: hypothetical protein ACE14P_06240 [Methanotrichaceae archaeon]
MVQDENDEILFDDPEGEEALNQLLGPALDEEGEDHAKVVKDVMQEARNGQPVKQPEPPKWVPSGPCFRAEVVDTEKMFSVDGKMIPESEMRALQEDPDLYNFLLLKQRDGLKPAPDTFAIVGQDHRNPDLDELDSVIGLKCAFCGEPIDEGEATVADLGSLVFYGTDKDGEPQVWHWEHLSLMCLLCCRGDYEKASKRFGLPFDELKAMRNMYFRSFEWGRLGQKKEKLVLSPGPSEGGFREGVEEVRL